MFCFPDDFVTSISFNSYILPTESKTCGNTTILLMLKLHRALNLSNIYYPYNLRSKCSAHANLISTTPLGGHYYDIFIVQMTELYREVQKRSPWQTVSLEGI